MPGSAEQPQHDPDWIREYESGERRADDEAPIPQIYPTGGPYADHPVRRLTVDNMSDEESHRTSAVAGTLGSEREADADGASRDSTDTRPS